MGSESFKVNEAQAIMWIVWKRSDHGHSQSGSPLSEFKLHFGRGYKKVLESDRLSVGYYGGQSVVFASPKLRGVVKDWLFDGVDGSGVPLSYEWRSRLRPIYGVG
jgi:hypothetical protein